MSQALTVSLQHVVHSRTEPGCISHNVYQDPENPLRLFFYEQWADQDAINAHFILPSSKAFVAAVKTLVSVAPNLNVFSAEQVK
jgi:quinol monooxygenase YgiN